MINLNGYSISEKIHEGEKSILYRGKKKDQPVIIKILNNDYPSTSELSKFKHEYDILENINSDYIIKTISIEKYKNSIAIVFEDIGGESLATLYNSVSSYSIKEILNIMILSIKALGEVHKLNLVHKDIKPHNIIFNKSSQVLKIIDFGNASLLVKQNSFISLNSSIEGTLAYISPEQTGRMNRTVDYRTDYYSLGVTFYRILTGGLPFLAKDPIELVHSHIAKNPISPFQKNKTPKPISDIIVKLLQKNPEDRYQSSSGILYDLEKCLKLLEEKGLASLDTESFGIGEFDFSPKFQIPEKLYGREKEINQIIDTFKKVAEGNTELLLISGRSGIGKSVLINEINKPITKYKGYFASGKYDTFKKTIPYRAISYAVQSLIQQILTESSTSIQSWKKNILDAIGTNGKIIIDVIPELETLIGEQPPVPELGTTESQNRFNIVFQNFIKAICSKEHPIAIFLDDLQWADIPSINLIQALLSNPDLKYLFLMLSFRDNEVLPKDPFSIMLDDLKNGGLKFNKISLEPISLTDISSLVSDTLNSADIIAKELAKVLFEKTKGNPFFVNELFKSFYEKEFIQYKNNNWIWDIKKIQDVKISENVIDLMLEKVKELSDSAIEKLKLAACIGSWFKQEVFFKILDKTESEAKEDLLLLANEGFLRLGEFDVNFVHDKIREATYTLISETERSRYHYTIGNTYLSMLDKYKLEDHIFTIVNQLNQGLAYITSEEEKVKLKELNRIAGNKAIASNAYDAALGFYQNSINQLPENSWEDNYFYTLDLYTNRARSEYLSKEYLSAEKTFDLILTKAKTPLDKIVIYELKSSMYVSQNKMLEAIVILKQALKSFGVNLPNNPTEISPLPEIIKFKLKFGKRQTEDLLNHTLTTEKKSLAIMGLLNALSAPAFLAQPALFPVIVLKMVNFSLTHGNTPLSPFAYAAFGIIQGSALGDFEAGYKFGKLALDLIKKIGEQTKPIECRTYFLFATMINHWKHHAKENKALYNHAFEKGMEAGDLQYGSYSLNNIFFQGVMIRENLSILSENFIKYRKSILSLQQHNAYQLYQLNEQFVSNMRDLTENKLMLVGEFYDETKVLPELIESKNANALFDFYVCKTRLEYFFGDLHQALEYSSLASTHEAAMFGMMFVPEQVFFDSLICAKLILNTKDKKKSKDYKKRLDKNYKRIKKWGENCQANYGHKLHILQGLIYQIENNQDKALSSFDQAIELSQQYDYILEEALANEFIASIWLERNKEPFAYIYLNAAHYAYKKWGCEPKVKQLESKYPQLKRQTKHKFNNESSIDDSMTISSSATNNNMTEGNFLDLNTVIKASQTISGEIQLAKLLEKMMKILFENAGAERGFFILKDKDKFYIEAEGNANTDTIEVLKHISLEGYNELSPNIVNYVTRTKGIVLLNDAVKTGIFINDSYVKEKKPKSVMCYPIINQGNLLGAVYLENNLTTNAFTPDRVEILKILSSQIAVSVENSILYANLEEKVEERTRDLNQALTEVSALKEQQDGDYFLNTLLIEPLSQCKAFSKVVHIESFIKQKKSFIFRKNEYELGGDINITEIIELQGKKYIVFLNGDAMGKSIQGAGGVLVLGTVFKSIIQRTISTASGRNQYPERWLKNAFIEMHKTFEAFDGSMLMSIAFGLIDEETGTMYFMNVEHPDIVLYRDGIPHFIKPKNQYRKLGTQGQTGHISIDIFPLLPDDIILLGSDGRDDLIIGKDEEYDLINQNEELFLDHVKNGNGDLEKIFESITNAGKLMDDLSLLKVHFKGKLSNVEKLKEDLKLFEKYKTESQFERIAELGKKLISDYPHVSDYLYDTALAYRALGKYQDSIDFGERLRLRDSKNISNLLTLIESYKSLGQKDKAFPLLEICLKEKPEDIRFHKLKNEFGV